MSRRRRSVLLMTLAITLLATMDLVVKLASAEFSTVQIAWGRYLAQSLGLLAFGGIAGVTAGLHSRIPGTHLFRAGLLLAANLLFMAALRYLPLAEANVIGFASPLLLTALAYPVLRRAGRASALARGDRRLCRGTRGRPAEPRPIPLGGAAAPRNGFLRCHLPRHDAVDQAHRGSRHLGPLSRLGWRARHQRGCAMVLDAPLAPRLAKPRRDRRIRYRWSDSHDPAHSSSPRPQCSRRSSISTSSSR